MINTSVGFFVTRSFRKAFVMSDKAYLSILAWKVLNLPAKALAPGTLLLLLPFIYLNTPPS